MPVLVDTSVWIEYFRKGETGEILDFLIEENLVVINDLILAELVPYLRVRRQDRVVELLHHLNNPGLEIDWKEIIDFQYLCLHNGLNGIGTPDLIIAQNAKQHDCEIYSLDGHFRLMKDILGLRLTEDNKSWKGRS
ncbi:MAG TPA: PIN domain-containing protein [Syntrophales bacterium]|nr:PIN domain-containing protein [Syntrophales bacterium]HQI35929.1 PIN domain-containing protein [Syntrophales bacterium]HRR47649.1 PIN domain-containing protein [Syntrophales bacterium]